MTPKQIETLACIQTHIRENRIAPTQAELAEQLGVSQPLVSRRLKALERRGAIECFTGLARGIRLVATSRKDIVEVKRIPLECQMAKLLNKVSDLEAKLASANVANDT